MVVLFLTGFTEIALVQEASHLIDDTILLVMIIQIDRHAAFYTILNDSIKMILRQHVYLIIMENSLEFLDFFDIAFL